MTAELRNIGPLRPATVDRFSLGEGPVWDAPRERLLWVDIAGCAVHEGVLSDATIEQTSTIEFDDMVGAVAVAVDGTLLVAARKELVRVYADGHRKPVARVIPSASGRRTNDGAVDPQGRFLIGTLSLDAASECEQLLRLEPDGRLSTLDDDLTLSNGIAWSADGRRMYNVDTLRQTVYVREYDDGPRSVHLTIEEGFPDGVALDADDHLWIAIWGGGAVQRYAPDGTLVARLEVPAPHTSSVAFAGDDLRTLVVSSATIDMSDEQLRLFPDSGKLFTVRVDVPGVPLRAWTPPMAA